MVILLCGRDSGICEETLVAQVSIAVRAHPDFASDDLSADAAFTDLL